MEARWKEVFPDVLPAVTYMDENKAQSSIINTNITSIFVFLGLISLILSSIGLFSLVSLNIIKRTKEIGIRRVLGASIPVIIRNLGAEFIIILIVASAIGSALGYFLAFTMIGSIWTYYLPLGIFPFVISIAGLLVISLVTVGGKIYGAASMNPSLSLRNE
jgi:ABC-type antimicrobial peptide transport system permease subunit